MKNIKNRKLFLIASIVMVVVMLCFGTASADIPNTYTGTWGNLTWKEESQDLTITGSGAMDDFSESSGSAWRQGLHSTGIRVTLDDRITSIGNYAFYRLTQITSIHLPTSLSSIGIGAFQKCWNLTSVTIPKDVSQIGENAFNGCTELASINLPANLKIISDYAFTGTKISSIEIPSNVTSIGTYAFDSCTNLSNVIFNGYPTSFDKYAFSTCSNLTSFIIPDGITRLEEGLFNNCSRLATLYIPDSVTYISNAYTFCNCNNLTTINFAGTEDQWNAISKTGWDQYFAANQNVKVNFGVASSYKVTFNANGHGTAPDSIKVSTSGEKISAPEDPEEKGWNFTGWYKEAECKNKWDFSKDTVNQNTTLYAGWKKAPKVTFDPNGHGTAPEPEYASLEGYFSIPDGLTADGWSFIGWFKEASCQTYWDPYNDTAMQDITLYAGWTNKFTVQFIDDFTKNDELIQEKVVQWGSLLQPPTYDVQIEGVDFLGWYSYDIGRCWDFNNDKVTSDLYLYPRWDINFSNDSGDLYVGYLDKSSGQQWTGGTVSLVFKIKVFSDPPIVISENTYDKCYGLPADLYPVTLTAVPDEGYTFAGWYQANLSNGAPPRFEPITLLSTESTYSVSFRNNKQSDAICAVFCKQYSISFVNENGEKLQTVKVNHGDTPTYTGATPTKAADSQFTYAFDSWSPAIVAATADATYKAKFTGTAIPVTPPASDGETTTQTEPGTSTQTQPETPTQTQPETPTQTEPETPTEPTAQQPQITGPVDIGDTQIEAIKDQAYTGKKLKPKLTITYSGMTLAEGTDYTLSYKKNKDIGKAEVTVKGKGTFTGSRKVKFNIVPKSVKLSKLKAGKKMLTVKWKKGKNITGYQIEYSLNADFSKSKTITVSDEDETETEIKKLKKKKTYYVRVRTFTKVGSKKYYSEWSAPKSQKTK